ncbi:MAG: rRNA maturation RNase YbeY [Bacteroidales bacterium]|nr:rRNA maturation RNase YbeY [Bacteroidales bacterium]
MVAKIYYRNVKFRLGKTKDIKNWIVQVIRSEGKRTGDLNFFFLSDEDLRVINNEFLNHDYYTDVITFNYGTGETIKGEIYMSIDTIRKNSHIYGTGIRDEILRVMVHGTLHLLGYDDKDKEGKALMRRKEDYYLSKLESTGNGL